MHEFLIERQDGCQCRSCILAFSDYPSPIDKLIILLITYSSRISVGFYPMVSSLVISDVNLYDIT